MLIRRNSVQKIKYVSPFQLMPPLILIKHKLSCGPVSVLSFGIDVLICKRTSLKWCLLSFLCVLLLEQVFNTHFHTAFFFLLSRHRTFNIFFISLSFKITGVLFGLGILLEGNKTVDFTERATVQYILLNIPNYEILLG